MACSSGLVRTPLKCLERCMTPALDLLKKVRAEHRVHIYEHDPKAASYGLEAAEKLGLEPAQVFKTLLASTEKGELLVAVVPVVGSLDLKSLAHAEIGRAHV